MWLDEFHVNAVGKIIVPFLGMVRNQRATLGYPGGETTYDESKADA